MQTFYKIIAILTAIAVLTMIAPNFQKSDAAVVDFSDYIQIDYDIWDGTYDFSWFETPAAENEYILNSAAAFAGFCLLTGDYSSETILLPTEQVQYLEQAETWSDCKITLTTNVKLDNFITGIGTFNGVLNLNNNCVCIGTTLFETIGAEGVIKNGCFTGNVKMADGEKIATEFNLINTNNGEISDVKFFWSDVGCKNCVFTFCNNNTGVMKAIHSIEGMYALNRIVYQNSGLIDGYTIEFVRELGYVCTNSTSAGRSNYAVSHIYSNSGEIKNGTIVSHSSGANDDCNLFYSYVIIYNNEGIIDNITINSCCFGVNYGLYFVRTNTQNGVVKNLNFDLTMKARNGQAGEFFIVYDNKGVLSDSVFQIKSDLFARGLFGSLTNLGANTRSSMQMGVLSESECSEKQIQNCNIKVEFLNNSVTNIPNMSLFSGYAIVDSTIEVTGLQYLMANGLDAPVIPMHVINSKIYLDYIYGKSSITEGNIIRGCIKDSEIVIDKYKGYNISCFGTSIFNSDLTIGCIADYVPQNGLFAFRVYDSDIVIKRATDTVGNLFGSDSQNSNYSITYGGSFNFVSSANYSYRNLQNCNVYIYFDNDASGAFNTLFQQCSLSSGTTGYAAVSISDTFIYIGPMPNNVYLQGPALIEGSSVYSYTGVFTPTTTPTEGIVLIAPHVNVNNSKALLNGFSIINARGENTGEQALPKNCYIDVDLYFANTGNVKYVSVLRPLAQCDANSVGNVFNIDVYDSNGSELNMPVYAYMTRFPHELNISDTIFRSNTKSPKSALVSFSEQYGGWQQVIEYNKLSISNCVFDLPNAKTTTETAGLIQATNLVDAGTIDDESSVFCGILQSLNMYNIHNNFVPEGQSVAYRRYDANTRLNSYQFIDSIYNSSDSGNTMTYVQYLVDDMNVVFTSENDAVDDTVYYSSDADIYGELAYLLDKGDTAARTYSWTVGEKSCSFYDILANKIVATCSYDTIPRYLSKYQAMNDTANLKPVFKATVDNSCTGGSVQLVGIASSVTNELTDIIYSKNEAYIVKAEEPIPKYAFVSAMETIDGVSNAIASIPRSRALSDYTISGYTMPYSDVIISPVFQRFYTISVNLTGQKTHANVDPSVSEAFENIDVSFDVNVDTGYVLTDLAWNETMFSEPYDGQGFTMPAQDVIVTGVVKKVASPVPTAPVKPVRPKVDRYSVDCFVEGEGELTASHYYTTEGTIVEIYPVAAEGYKLVNIESTVDFEGSSFEMPARDVEITAVFEKINNNETNEPVIPGTPFIPDTPVIPDEPDETVVPDEPDEIIVPDEPDLEKEEDTDNPKTGHQMKLLFAYLLAAAVGTIVCRKKLM